MPWLTRNAPLGRPQKLSLWRKISISSWRVTHDSSIVAVLELDAEPALRYLQGAQYAAKSKLTMTHYAGWVLAKVFAKHPEINCMVRWGALYPRESADICFLVASGSGRAGEGEDLSGIVVKAVDRKTLADVAVDLENQVRAIRKGEDVSFRGIKQLLSHFPHFVRRPLVNLADFIMHGLNLWTPLLGLRRDAFGSAMLTSVGSLGIEFAIARIYPQSRNSLILSVGAVRETPVVRAGAVVVGKTIKLVFTVDHRVVDGLHGGYMLRSVQEFFEDPAKTEAFRAKAD